MIQTIKQNHPGSETRQRKEYVFTEQMDKIQLNLKFNSIEAYFELLQKKNNKKLKSSNRFECGSIRFISFLVS